MISTELLEELKSCITKNTYRKAIDLSQIVRHLRNGIAHARIDFEGEQPPVKSDPPIINHVIIGDHSDASGKKPAEDFEIKIPVETLRKFFYEFSDAVAKESLKKTNSK